MLCFFYEMLPVLLPIYTVYEFDQKGLNPHPLELLESFATLISSSIHQVMKTLQNLCPVKHCCGVLVKEAPPRRITSAASAKGLAFRLTAGLYSHVRRLVLTLGATAQVND